MGEEDLSNWMVCLFILFFIMNVAKALIDLKVVFQTNKWMNKTESFKTEKNLNKAECLFVH